MGRSGCTVQEYPLKLAPMELCYLSSLEEWVLDDEFPFSVSEKYPSTRPSPLFLLPAFEIVSEPIATSLRSLAIEGVSGGYEQQQGLLAMLRHCPNLKAVNMDKNVQQV